MPEQKSPCSEAILVGIIDAVLLRQTMQFCSGVDSDRGFLDLLQQPPGFCDNHASTPERSYHENVRRPYWRESGIGISC